MDTEAGSGTYDLTPLGSENLFLVSYILFKVSAKNIILRTKYDAIAFSKWRPAGTNHLPF